MASGAGAVSQFGTVERGRWADVAVAAFVVLGSALGFVLTYAILNDQFDRLARAFQIATFGDVPFRDFMDPGYFLALYSSALLIRVVGHSLLGEALLNVGFMAAGCAVVSAVVSRASGSRLLGIGAALLVVAAQPRPYDYDKVLFYPLGVLACWRYADAPSVRRLAWLSATVVIAGLFRYDNAVYVGAATLVAIVTRHWGEWRTLAARLVTLLVLCLVVALPALLYVQSTAGLREAFTQVTDYARLEGERGGLGGIPDFGWGDEQRAARSAAMATLYWLELGVPLLACAWLTTTVRYRTATARAKLFSYAIAAELVALFILRNPIAARVGATVPMLLIGCSLFLPLAWEAVREFRHGGGPRAVTSILVCALLTGATVASIDMALGDSTAVHWDLLARTQRMGNQPPDLGLMPGRGLTPIVEYLRSCTRPGDPVLATWFVGELYFFSARPFAAGLPVMFGDHWSEPRYQQRAIRALMRHPAVLVLTERSGLSGSPAQDLWEYVKARYEMVREVTLPDRDPVQIWLPRGQATPPSWGPLGLPCVAG